MAGKKTGEKQPTVSVIIGTFNSAPTLPACLSSVFAQKYKNIEAIIVDKGSTDSTLEIARSFPVRIIEGHVERCTQWNAGAKIARGKFIYFLGADMETHQDFISEAVKKCLSSGASAIYTVVSTKSNAYWARVRGFERKFYLLDEKWQAARFIEKGVFWKIGGWNEKLVAGEDWDLQEKLNKGGFVTKSIGPYPDVHLDEPTSLPVICRKYYYYGSTLRKYFSEHGTKESVSKLQPMRGVFFLHPELFASNLSLVPGFFIYKAAQYSFSAMGYILGRHAAPQ